MEARAVKYEVISDLSESRSYRTRHAIARRGEEDTVEFFYTLLLTLLIAARHASTSKEAREMFGRASAFGNFNHFRISINDLYSLTYILSKEYDVLTYIMQRRLLRTYRLLSQGTYIRGEVEPLLYRLERMINIEKAEIRMARRVFLDWDHLTQGRKYAGLVHLRRIVRNQSIVADVLPLLTRLLEDHQ